MLENILNVKGVQVLSKAEQNKVKGSLRCQEGTREDFVHNNRQYWECYDLDTHDYVAFWIFDNTPVSCGDL